MTVLAWIQGIYFLITGLWPIFHIKSFMAVTGPKTDLWLVKTVSVLICSIAITLMTGAYRENIRIEIILLALSSAIDLTSIDVIYAVRGRISKVYLLDALVEIIFILLWAYFLLLQS